ncbi:putative pyridoxal phosphate-dependent aminotransferase EpsN [Crateriforma conspicua]|uniref:GDP-perosamine synthase n=1 Tax=Crateriforma conspicua TaxID=2527996 RepID=A0A5C6FXC6_9PLAN|nr:DegT/DnrJ/EryC1/StrS family aminotransferase [Crateriforma conspicua]TWU66994.1 putative pyridoxal phosphate-dependent aminotransferase EpsN [Crateriforma conspicua]
MQEIRIPVSKPDLNGRELEYVSDAINSTWISSTGKYLSCFERDFASLCSTGHAMAVCNGTVALHLAMLALDIRPGDEIIVPSMTYIATANACRYVGAEPVFVDVDPENWCIAPEKIEAAITTRTRGIVAVHLYGHPADMDTINEIAAVNGLTVIEDAAEAHLATYKGRPVGGLGRLATFSFYGNKTFTCGEGGAISTSDDQLAQRIRTLRGQGMDPKRRYYFPVTGYNFRLTNVAAALLCAQLERRDEILGKRKQIFSWYEERLRPIEGIELQPSSNDVTVTPWLFCMTVRDDAASSRDEIANCLRQEGIDTRPFFIPLHTLPPFREESAKRNDDLPVTNDLCRRGLNLPTYSDITESDIDQICEIVRDCVSRR